MDIIISNSSQEAIYEQIVKQIKKQIISKRLKSGDSLPSIRSLAKELQISVITVKRAYEELEKEGMIETVAAKGSYVAFYNMEFLRQKKMGLLEEKIIVIINEAKNLNVGKEELHQMLDLLFEEENL